MNALDAKADVVDEWRHDVGLFAEDNLKILNKEGRLVPFVLNEAQKRLNAACDAQKERTGRVRINLVKGRQMGMSTGVAARFVRDAICLAGTKVMVVCHKQEATKNLAQMTRRFYDHIPGDRKPRLLKKNDLELVMSSESGYLLTTAGSKETGRGSTIQRLHASEFAYWSSPEDHMAGLGNALADLPGTEAIRESTANGQANILHEEWRKAEAGVGSYENLFLPWYIDPGYVRPPPPGWKPSTEAPMDGMPSPAEYQEMYDLTRAQMYWREVEIQDKGLVKTVREYPATPQEAFITTGEVEFLSAYAISAARERVIDHHLVGGAELVIGVDPATSHGPDSSTIIRRRGPKAYGLELYPTITPDGLLSLIWSYWREERPTVVCVDRTEGVGDHVFTSLHARGVPVVGIYFGGRPTDRRRYYDKRAELYSRIVGWLPTADIPDDMDLARDLLAQRQSSKEQTQIRLRSKPELRADGHPSPDRADALACTMEHIDREYGGATLPTIRTDVHGDRRRPWPNAS